MKPDELTTDNRDADDFPTAKLEPRKQLARQVIGGSRMWWATLAAIVVAVVLVYRSIEQRGPRITVKFPDGHGLKVGDFVRYRGIDVGHVDEVDLADDLSSIRVAVTLFEGAGSLAREGTRFWIVRPQVSLTEVRGLETAVGAKYIAAAPGPDDAAQCFDFTGLATPPPGDVAAKGLEIVLRGDEGYGLYAGAPVAWRGVDVGQVLSVDLASDTRFVDVRVRIDNAYRNLVRTNSMFWATSGLGIDAGLTGFTLKAESLTTIARGGVSFITPIEGASQHVRPGHVFTLYSEEESEWTEDASTVSLVDFPLPQTVTLRANWKEKSFGFTRNREANATAIVMYTGDDAEVIAPAAAFERPEAALGDSWSLAIIASDTDDTLQRIPADFEKENMPGGVTRYSFSLTPAIAKYGIEQTNLRTVAAPEDVCLVRTVASGEGPSSVIYSVSRTQLAHVGPVWQVDTHGIDFDDWNGAVVVGTEDGSVVGLFVAAPSGPMVALLGNEAAK